MSDKYILDSNGDAVPCDDLMRWAKWYEKADRKLRYSTIGAVRVSTIFLGLDHSFGEGPPLLWETMVFGGKHDEFMDRYASRADAVDGHERVVRMILAEGETLRRGAHPAGPREEARPDE